MRIVENRRDRRDYLAVFYAVLSFIAPKRLICDHERQFEKTHREKAEKLEKYQIVEKSDESKTALQECLKGKNKPLASALQGALFCIVIFFTRGVAAQGVC